MGAEIPELTSMAKWTHYMQALLYAAQELASTNCSADPIKLGRGMAMAIALELLDDYKQYGERGVPLKVYAERVARGAKGFGDLFANYVTKMKMYLPILGAIGSAIKQVDLSGLPIPEELKPAVEESLKVLLDIARRVAKPSQEELCAKAKYIATVIGYGKYGEVKKTVE